MENRPFDPEEQDDLDPQASSKKKRSSTFSKFLSNLRRKEHEKLDSGEEDDDTESEKPKRFRRLFNRLFPSVVEHPDQQKPTEQEHPMDYEAWFSWRQQQASTPEANTDSPEEPTIEAAQTVTEAETPVKAREESESANEAQEGAGPTEGEVNSTIESQQELQGTPVEAPQSDPWEQEIRLRPSNTSREELKSVAPTTSEKVERETVIERGPGMALPVALVGLEYLGRKKADKKLEARVNEKITATNKEVNRGTILQQELETVVKQNREQLEALKQARTGRATETAPVPRPTVERIERPLTTQNTPETTKKAPEVVPGTPTEQLRRTVSKEERVEEVKPQKILEQVADAAEHNIAVERVFERSHEVKDDQTAPGAAASIGAVMAAHAKTAQYQPVSQAQPAGSHYDGHLPFVTDKRDAAAYKQAMNAGFWAGVMIIILGSIAYLVIK